MDLTAVEYTTRQFKLKEHIWLQRFSQKNDYEAMLELIVCRSNITAEEALELDWPEILEVITNISNRMVQSIALAELSKELGDATG